MAKQLHKRGIFFVQRNGNGKDGWPRKLLRDEILEWHSCVPRLVDNMTSYSFSLLPLFKGLDSALDSVLHSDLSNLFCHQIKWGLIEILIYLSGILASKMFYFSVLLHVPLLKLGQLSNYEKKLCYVYLDRQYWAWKCPQFEKLFQSIYQKNCTEFLLRDFMKFFYRYLIHKQRYDTSYYTRLWRKVTKIYLEYCVYIIIRCAASKWKLSLFWLMFWVK